MALSAFGVEHEDIAKGIRLPRRGNKGLKLAEKMGSKSPYSSREEAVEAGRKQLAHRPMLGGRVRKDAFGVPRDDIEKFANPLPKMGAALKGAGAKVSAHGKDYASYGAGQARQGKLRPTGKVAARGMQAYGNAANVAGKGLTAMGKNPGITAGVGSGLAAGGVGATLFHKPQQPQQRPFGGR